jgi:hypothetical protein
MRISLVAVLWICEAHQQNKRIPHMQNFATVFAQFLSLVAKYMFVKLSKQHKGSAIPGHFSTGPICPPASCPTGRMQEPAGRVMGMNAAAKRLYCWST